MSAEALASRRLAGTPEGLNVRRPAYELQRDSDEQLALLLLPGPLEEFVLAAHARELLTIQRVVALEPSRVPTPRFLRDWVPMRQARRLRLPGHPRLLVLYHPEQYPLARALLAHYELAELWYVAPDPSTLGPGAPGGAVSGGPGGARASGEDAADELLRLDELARAHATEIVGVGEDAAVDDGALRIRLRELGVINHRPFVPPRRWGRVS